MKAKLTLSIEEDLIPKAKRLARSRGVSLSRLVEGSLLEDLSASPGVSFSEKWRGRFRPADRGDERYRRLAEKYL